MYSKQHVHGYTIYTCTIRLSYTIEGCFFSVHVCTCTCIYGLSMYMYTAYAYTCTCVYVHVYVHVIIYKDEVTTHQYMGW